jgi:hypothetical protein
MKITKRILSLLLPGMAAASLLVACSDDDSGGSSNNNGGNDQGAAGAPTVIVETGFECPAPGESFCNGSASGIVCAKGSTNGVPFTCAQGEVCDDGTCVGQCEAKATECVGKQAYRICSDDGKQWVPVACQPGEECVDGACESTAPVCAAGEIKCDGATVQTCKSDGSGWDEAECPSGTECTDGGACVGVCTVGETRCDPTTHDLALAMFGSGDILGGEGANYGVLWKCVDGTKWELEACGEGEFCTYSGIDQSEVDRYKSELIAFGMNMIFAEGPYANVPSFPKPPTIPAGAQASCGADTCELQADEPFFYADNPFSFFEASGVRQCGAPDDDEESSAHAKLSSCSGLPPYQAFEVTTVECPADTMCAPGYPERGCVVPRCEPAEETYCSGDYVYYCDSYYLEEYSQQWCQYGCAETGTAPERTATCNPPPAPVE